MVFEGLLTGHTAVDLAILVFVVVVMPLTSMMAGRRLASAPPRSLVPRYLRIMARGWAIVTVVIAAWWLLGRPFSELGLGWPIPFWGRLGFLFDALAAIVLGVQLVRLGKLVKPENFPRYRRMIEEVKIAPRTAPELGVFLLTSVTGGIWEELVYRGFLIWFLTPLSGIAGAVVLSSLVFGLAHVYQSWRAIFRTGAFGLVVGVAYVLSGSLWWLMVAHALADINGGITIWRLTAIMREEPQSGPA
ncbi:MAG TPA: type II CAAX endopeptidase family protein [Rhizomicrobium sp.]|jgi:hypothetical protein|nr:type II CAAX endopeptidase family protein [Rhizomicrobium sp.]